MVNITDVKQILQFAIDAEIKVFLDGGWGVDALLGYQSRAHNDIDIFVEKNEPVQKISETEVEKLLNLREKYNADKQRVLEGHDDDYLSKLMIKNDFCEFKKHEEGKKLSNYEAVRINLAKKIMNSFGYKNAMPSRLTCPKCEGHIACQIKKALFPQMVVDKFQMT